MRLFGIVLLVADVLADRDEFRVVRACQVRGLDLMLFSVGLGAALFKPVAVERFWSVGILVHL